MIVSAIFDLLLALILYVYAPKSEAIKWAVLFLIFTGIGSLSEVVVDPGWRSAFFFILQVCSPYGFIMFTIVNSAIVTRLAKNLLAYVLVLPIVVTLFISPLKPEIQIDFIILLLWAGSYYLVGCFFLIYAYLREKNPINRRNRMITACFFVPPILAIVVFNHMDRAIHQNFHGYLYLSIFVWLGFVIFIISAIRFGMLGLKIRFEKQVHDQTINGITMGAAMLNHAMKNRITNIDLLTGRMKESMELQQNEQLNEDIERIVAETNQMMHMVKRIQKQIEDVEIVNGAANLIDIVTQALRSNRYLLESKGISVVTDFAVNYDMMCDKIHLQEAFSNMIHNAIDAMDAERGMVTIKIYEGKTGVQIDFTDNGRGIEKEAAARIFDPFYSTKHREENFGLGLSYCYLIMQKHAGSISVTSAKEVGTTFTVHFPKYRKI